MAFVYFWQRSRRGIHYIPSALTWNKAMTYRNPFEMVRSYTPTVAMELIFHRYKESIMCKLFIERKWQHSFQSIDLFPLLTETFPDVTFIRSDVHSTHVKRCSLVWRRSEHLTVPATCNWIPKTWDYFGDQSDVLAINLCSLFTTSIVCPIWTRLSVVDRSAQTRQVHIKSPRIHLHTPPNPTCSLWYDHEWLKADY